MDEFRVLSEDELAALTSKERREYQKQLKEYNNKKMVEEIVNQGNEDISKAVTPNIPPDNPPEPTKKKSNAGRKAIAASEKKQQIMITIEADSKAKLESVDTKNFKKLLGRYIDKNIDSIVKAIEQL